MRAALYTRVSTEEQTIGRFAFGYEGTKETKLRRNGDRHEPATD